MQRFAVEREFKNSSADAVRLRCALYSYMHSYDTAAKHGAVHVCCRAQQNAVVCGCQSSYSGMCSQAVQEGGSQQLLQAVSCWLFDCWDSTIANSQIAEGLSRELLLGRSGSVSYESGAM